MVPKVVKRRIRPMWLAAAALGAWTNRRDIARWYRFARRAIDERQRRPLGDLLTEARVRATISTDPVLRRDKALDDVSVDDGVVTLHTTSGGWPDPHDQIWRLKQVKGITDVTSQLMAS
jgi:hypothetical protein